MAGVQCTELTPGTTVRVPTSLLGLDNKSTLVKVRKRSCFLLNVSVSELCWLCKDLATYLLL